MLASVGVTWYTWLEQGRTINVSAQVLSAVGRALKLDAAETAYLRSLAGLPPTASDGPTCDPALLMAIQPVLDKLDPYPACVQTPFFDVVAYNRAYRLLFADLDLLPESERNCAVQFFKDPQWRELYRDPDIVASRMVARLRSEAGVATDQEAPEVIGRLQDESDEFARLWARHDVLLERYEVKQLNSPAVGDLNLNFVSTIIPDTNHRMTVMTPADGETTERLGKLVERETDGRDSSPIRRGHGDAELVTHHTNRNGER